MRIDEHADIIAGVDGCRAGWLCIVLNRESGEASARISQDFASLLNGLEGTRVIAIDIPVGLKECGVRACDGAARKILGKPRSNSVFPAPVRAALRAESHHEASVLNRRACGKGLSIQSFGILPKIRQVDSVMTPELQRCVFEVHPEVSFWALNNNHAMKHSKHSGQGRKERINLLAPVYRNLESLLTGLNKKGANIDDLLDAAVATWTAGRIAGGSQERTCTLEVDTRGLRMEILY